MSCGATLGEDHQFCSRCGAPAPAPTHAEPVPAGLVEALGPNFQVLRLLGRGGMGSVYLARDLALDRLVAVKVRTLGPTSDAQTRERFRREARTAARLTHPHVVPLHAFGETEGLAYFVMGYVRGESLGARLRREGRLPPEEARRILAEIADALDYGHRNGVVHRDVKPDNILIDDETGRSLLADFGVARSETAHSTLTADGAIVGTPSHLSPEQASGQASPDGRSDLYALGVTGFQMLSGRLPFDGRSVQEVLMKHLTQPPPRLEASAPDLPLELAGAVMRCLAKNPDDRWPTARSLREAIAPGGSGAGVPESLDDLDGVGFWAVATGLGVAYIAWLERFWKGYLDPVLEVAIWLLPLALPALFVARLAVQARIATRHGHSPSEILRAAFWPPDGWPFYPARWRRPGDVWPRLPLLARLLRALMAGAILVIGLLFLPAAFVILSPFYWENSRSPDEVFSLVTILSLFTFTALLASIPLAFLVGDWWGRRHGLAGPDRYRMFFGATKSSPFWKRPHIQALLKPPATPRSAASATTQIDTTDRPTTTSER